MLKTLLPKDKITKKSSQMIFFVFVCAITLIESECNSLNLSTGHWTVIYFIKNIDLFFVTVVSQYKHESGRICGWFLQLVLRILLPCPFMYKSKWIIGYISLQKSNSRGFVWEIGSNYFRFIFTRNDVFLFCLFLFVP